MQYFFCIVFWKYYKFWSRQTHIYHTLCKLFRRFFQFRISIVSVREQKEVTLLLPYSHPTVQRLSRCVILPWLSRKVWHLHSLCKKAIIKSLLKITSLVQENLKTIFGKLVFSLKDNRESSVVTDLCVPIFSAQSNQLYRPNHSIETALLKVASDILPCVVYQS